MFVKLFKIGANGIEINKEEIALYKPINKIISRDRGSLGDADGRKKLKAIKDLSYIYFYCNPESEPNRLGYSDKLKHDYAIKMSGLPTNYVIDSDIKEAIVSYNESLASCLSLELLNNSRKAISASNKALSILANRLDKQIEKINDNTSDADLKVIIDMSNDILQVLEDIPNMVSKLEKAEQLVYNQIEAIEEKRGGGNIPSTYENDN